MARANKRNLFDELMDGVAAMKAHRTGKITLRTYKVEARALPEVKPKMIKQGRAKPNAQAAALLLLAARYPDTFERLERLAE